MMPTHEPATDSSARNPFNPATPDGPFAGREGVLVRIHRHLTDAPTTAPLVVTGRRHIGKSALLRQFIRSDENLIGVYVTLSQMPLDDESALLTALSQQIVDSVQANGHVPDSAVRNPDRGDVLAWLKEVCLPAVYRAIWRKRRIALLLDEAHLLADAVTSGTLDSDFPAVLHGLLGPQFGIALAMDEGTEDALPVLSALVPAENVVRLGILTVTDVAALCERWLAPCEADAATALCAASGGEPLLIQRFGQALYALPAAADEVITVADVKAVADEVYTTSTQGFARVWAQLDSIERQVLTAISQLRYDDPTRSVDTGRIEAWTVQTDFPLDATAINAAMRGLEYREVVGGKASAVNINGELMQRWLIEHAASGGKITLTPADGALSTPDNTRRLLIAAALVGLLLILLVGVASLNSSGGNEGDAVPTITLAPRPT